MSILCTRTGRGARFPGYCCMFPPVDRDCLRTQFLATVWAMRSTSVNKYDCHRLVRSSIITKRAAVSAFPFFYSIKRIGHWELPRQAL
jgi:hypothetical protein